jgi:DNA ligase-1
MQIKKPMLAGNYDPEKAVFPYIATPKIDGIRFVMVNGVALSRSFKPLRNKYIQSLLSSALPDGMDGELTSGDTFQSSTSAIMKIEGEPEFDVWLFDYLDPSSETILSYSARMKQLSQFNLEKEYPFTLHKLLGKIVNNQEELEKLDDYHLDSGFEGTMLRSPSGTYKFGRSTVRDNILLKVKRFTDDEGLLIDVHEKMSNQNDAEIDELGHTKRSSALDGMIPMNTAGSLVVSGSYGEVKVGSGLDDKMREYIWSNRDSLIGNSYVKYKFFPQGVKDLPRHPVFIGFRDSDDM